MKRRAALWLLVLPFIALLVPPFYARSAPQLGGFPFFYWYMLLWVVLSGLVCGIAYFATREPERD